MTRIYISGPIEVAKQIIREHVLAEPLCVTVTPTTFVYTGGEEAGYVVGLEEYPRFPSTEEYRLDRAIRLAVLLRDRTFQRSAMVVSGGKSHWLPITEV